jgi:hypothetical protein
MFMFSADAVSMWKGKNLSGPPFPSYHTELS